MARYIDVEALMKELGIADDCDNCAWNGEGKCMKGEGFADACVAMEDAPTADVVEVVRCKDCKQWEEVTSGRGFCKDMYAFGRWWKENDYCSYGERREDGEIH